MSECSNVNTNFLFFFTYRCSVNICCCRLLYEVMSKPVTYSKSLSTGSFECVEIPENPLQDVFEYKPRKQSSYEIITNDINNKFEEETCKHEKPCFIPLSAKKLKSLFNADGVVNESALREAVFNGGCEPNTRKVVWSLLFELYPMTSTFKEQELIKISNNFRYYALKKKCFEQLCASYFQEPEDESNHFSWVEGNHQDIKDYANMSQEEFKKQKLEAEDFAKEQTVDLATVEDWYKVITKDIPRTDIDHPYFHQSREKCLAKMQSILVVFGFFHPKIGYVQGMNDILTRFMIVLDSEVDAYWCFSRYMESVEKDFDEDGMIEKIELVCKLLQDLEPNLYSHFQNCSVPDLVFCHRWLLVSFKREFDYEESIRYFEIVHSRHLKFDSAAVQITQADQYRQEIEKRQGTPIKKVINNTNAKFTLDVFVCVSVIMLKRQEFLACKDAAEVFNIACNIRGTLNLQHVHEKANALFFRYCRKCIKDQYTNENDGVLQSLAKSLREKLLNANVFQR
ncbi:unnamed protein product [Clavelina lepadiformis]|uniref:Rab-GAP TBC domain-containing protein n=1 Tax=Clavelina lepadiformis TaxID=159417 RepID=A0ABP0FDZ9_CLALP